MWRRRAIAAAVLAVVVACVARDDDRSLGAVAGAMGACARRDGVVSMAWFRWRGYVREDELAARVEARAEAEAEEAEDRGARMRWVSSALTRACATRAPTIWLGILGEAFDVSRGREHYGVGGGYEFFAGRDASRAFVSGNFTEDGLVADITGLSPGNLESIRGWRNFMREKYAFVGYIRGGAFYDERGEPTAMKHAFDAGVALHDVEKARAMERRAMYEDCSSVWNERDGGFVWCSPAEDGVERYPRNETTVSASGEHSSRCACFREIGVSDVRRVYSGCALTDTRCQTSTGSTSSE